MGLKRSRMRYRRRSWHLGHVLSEHSTIKVWLWPQFRQITVRYGWLRSIIRTPDPLYRYKQDKSRFVLLHQLTIYGHIQDTDLIPQRPGNLPWNHRYEMPSYSTPNKY